MPENSIGNLLTDYNNISAARAICVTRHNSLVDYLKPIVEKERARKLTPAEK